MAEKSIVTQSQLGSLKSALAQEADSLQFHAGDSMSAAHGFNVMNGPANDGNGNDLTYYLDSNGDVVGTAMLHVVILGVDYYVPVAPTALAGQDPSAGVVPDLSTLLQPGNNTWVTDYATEATDDANLVMTGLLLPHTRQYYAETHSGLSIQVLDSFDNQGHLVGNRVLVLYFGQKKIFIPCSTKLGGMSQPPGIAPATQCPALIEFSGNYGGTTLPGVCQCFMRFEQKAGESNPGQFHIQWSGITGTLPMLYTVQYSSDGTSGWQNLPPNTGTPINNVGLTTQNALYGCGTVLGSVSGGRTVDFAAYPTTAGGDSGGAVYLRLKLDNSTVGAGGGLGYTCAVRYWIQDNAKCCWFCTEAHKHRHISPEKWKLIGRVEQTVYKLDRRALASYVKHGDRLVERMVAHGVKPEHFVAFTDKIVDLAVRGYYEEAARFYVQFVANEINLHWPESTHRGWKPYLKTTASVASPTLG